MSSTLPSRWAASALAAVLSACSQIPVGTPGVVECSAPVHSERTGSALVGQPYGMAMSPIPLNAVQFGNAVLSRSVVVQSLHAARTPTDTVRIYARFVSCLDEPLAIRMRTSFLRSDTAPAEPSSAWKYVFLPARTTAVYEESSVSRDVVSYLIEVGL
jgi:hypothetical protein